MKKSQNWQGFAAELNEKKFFSRRHAGMDAASRRRAQDEWLAGKKQTVVATTTFGMGIDKPDVRAVIHYQHPASLETYYQEAGRAGLPSRCAVLYSGKAVLTCFFPSNNVKLEVELDLRQRTVMKIITMLELRKNTAQVIRWSQKGLRMTVTYRGTPVMKIEPIRTQRQGTDDPFYDLCGIAEKDGGSLSNEAMDTLIYEL